MTTLKQILSNRATAKKNIKHGLTKSSEYKIWQAMKNRCLNKNVFGYEYYGGRGIKICKRWSRFENFLGDIGKRPSKKHTLDRINCNGNYEPKNCRWATRAEQSRNTRKTKFKLSDILEIRKLSNTGITSVELSKKYSCHSATIRKIWNGTIWKV